MPLIIGLSGKACAGKDTLADPHFTIHGYKRMSFAEVLKETCQRLFKLTKEQTDGRKKDEIDKRYNLTPRDILVRVGNFCRLIDPNIWVRLLMEKIDALPAETRVVITDVRYTNEANAIREKDGVLIRLERHPSRDKMVDANAQYELSETDLDNYPFFDMKLEANQNENPQDLEKFAYKVHEYIARREQ